MMSETAHVTHNVQWVQELGDVGQFSYVATCAVTLYELFQNTEWDKDFQGSCLKLLIKHLKLSHQVETSAFALMDGQGSDNADCFVDMLKSEPVIEKLGPQVVIQDLITLAVKDGCYDSRMRTLIGHVAVYLRVEQDIVEDFEETLIENLVEEDHVMTEDERKEKESKERKQKFKRFALIGLATVGGGTLLGLTGGLAAPLLAAGVGTVVGATGAAALGSTAGVAIIGSLFGVAGAGLGGYKMKKRVGDVEEFAFEPLTDMSDMHITIAVTGWLTEEEADFCTPWLNMKSSREQYTLRYESKYLKNMGAAMDYLLGYAINAAAHEALKYTVLSGILAAITWPATLLTMASVIDNPWSVCTHRTAVVGKLLAEVLLSRQQGKRPVTLVGYSLGARVIFYCITELARRKKCEGIVEDVIMLGAPVSGSVKDWQPLRRVVAGKIVNGYCRHDWLLKFLYRTTSVQFTIAGLQPVKWHDRRMQNIDLSDVVNGHLDYKKKLDYILNVVGVRTRDQDYVIEEAKEATDTENPSEQWMVIHKGKGKSEHEDSQNLPNSNVMNEELNLGQSKLVNEMTPESLETCEDSSTYQEDGASCGLAKDATPDLTINSSCNQCENSSPDLGKSPSSCQKEISSDCDARKIEDSCTINPATLGCKQSGEKDKEVACNIQSGKLQMDCLPEIISNDDTHVRSTVESSQFLGDDNESLQKKKELDIPDKEGKSWSCLQSEEKKDEIMETHLQSSENVDEMAKLHLNDD